MRVAVFVLCLVVCCTPRLEGLLHRGQHSDAIQRQNGKFGETIRDWFRYIKSHTIFGRIGKAKPKIEYPDSNQMAKEEFTIIDLKTLKFDPKHDWGYQIGNWYYIYKNPNNAVEPVISNDHDQEEGEEGTENAPGHNGGERKDGNVDETENAPSRNGGEWKDEQTSSTPLEPNEVSIPTKSSNNTDGKGDKDNGQYSGQKKNDSVDEKIGDEAKGLQDKNGGDVENEQTTSLPLKPNEVSISTISPDNANGKKIIRDDSYA